MGTAMIAIKIITWAILGGLWRRAMGGWLGLSRSTVIYYGIASLSSPVGFLVGENLWWPYGILAYLLTFGASFLFFVCGLHLVDWLYDWLEPRWNPAWQIGGFVDGPRSVVELISGAVWFGVIGLFWIWVV